MSWFSNLWATTIGKKIVMAITGLIVFGFVLGHMSGNLLIFAGADVFNDYAHTLQTSGPLLWGTRLTLLAAIPLHIVSAVQLTRLNMGARQHSYDKHEKKATTPMAMMMKYGGLLLMVFILLHLAHYTLHLTNPEFATYMTADGNHDAYRMVIEGFSSPVYVGVYLLAMVALWGHLDHGAWSMFQTLGLSHPDYNDARRNFARVFAALIVLGFCSVPVAVMAGLVS
jgi:succinate dehydrogenase / fumarate reductase cytochrome b subunit